MKLFRPWSLIARSSTGWISWLVHGIRQQQNSVSCSHRQRP